jgi:hypothetical protein
LHLQGLGQVQILENGDELWCCANFTYAQQFAEKAKKQERKKTFEQIVPEHYRGFAKVFSEEASERLPKHCPGLDHPIDLTDDAPPSMNTKVYPLTGEQREWLHMELADQLRQGIIRPSKSPFAAPVFVIKKKSGGFRMIHDLHKLNNVTVKNKYPLPLIEAILDQIQGAKYFTKLDVRWGYHNIRIHKGDKWKLAFLTPDGLYKPTVMMFGLCNAPATFQGFMNHIFADLVARGKVAIYLDNILIFTSDLNEHRKIVKEVLKRMQDNDLYLRPEKCKFETMETKYLGVVVKQGQICMDPIKVKGIVKWEAPQNVSGVRKFLGFANYYRCFIKGYSSLARPLNNRTKKDQRWQCTNKEETAFQAIKQAFVTEPVLAQWETGKPVRVETDASNYTTGGVLSQKKDNGQWHPIAYRSTSMTEAECNYQIYNKEMLAIIRALEDWRHYLEGTSEPFEIITDHDNLKW